MLKTENESKTELLAQSLKNSVSYADYRNLVANHAQNKTSTGPAQSETLTNYTVLSHARMKRLDKTVKVSEEIQEKFKSFKGNQTWVVLTESWCGDAAQSMPAMNLLANLAPDIDFKVVLRDDNLELMDTFLTNGSRSIPKLIILDNDTQVVIADWGPRPSIATGLVNDYKAEHGMLTPEFKKDLQIWYYKDKSQNIIENLAKLID
ncbi:MAG: thioredoxin family protein [Flavobacteriaceae bacterium]|nr:thioredoxin family protein [Flavobacteriaceae bacterium]